MIEYRWLTDSEIDEFVNPICRRRGWMQLNLNPTMPTCRVLGAFDEGEVVGFMAIQLLPCLGPDYTDANHRDGAVNREMAERMDAFLQETGARGALAICENPATERLAIRHGMAKLDMPVYTWTERVSAAQPGG